ncbi:TPA: hypothetical protein ACH3X2_008500 [Trebouxia sp. C0005]
MLGHACWPSTANLALFKHASDAQLHAHSDWSLSSLPPHDAWVTNEMELSRGHASTVHMHLLSLGVVDDMCKGKKPASESGMQPLLPASLHVAAQSCCFQASTGGQAASYLTHCCCCWWFSTRGQVALLMLLPDQHSRSGCTAAVLLVLHRRQQIKAWKLADTKLRSIGGSAKDRWRYRPPLQRDQAGSVGAVLASTSWILLSSDQIFKLVDPNSLRLAEACIASLTLAGSPAEQQAALELFRPVLSWLGDLSMWCYGLCEDMAGLSRPTDWAEAAIWLLCAQMEQILITRLLIQVNLKQTPMICFSMLSVPF